MSTSWAPWVRGIEGLSPTEKLIAYELALLADTRGVSVVPIGHLERVTSRSRRSVQAALQRLEDRGLMRAPEAMPHPFQGTRLQLIRGGPPGEAAPQKPTATVGTPHGTTAVPIGGNESLRTQLTAASAANWTGQPCWELAATLEKEGPQHFASLIGQRRSAGVTDPWDTLTLAWEVMRDHCGAILAATEPWGLWVHLVRVECHHIDPRGTPKERVEFDAVPQTSHMPDFGIDDFGSTLSGTVQALVNAGVDEAVAWAGTVRVLELVGVGQSRRHWMAGRDAKLRSLGIGEQAARAWMTLLIGSRRGRAGVLTGADSSDVWKQAAEVALRLRNAV